MRTMRNRSPGTPPFKPAFPFPCRRMRWPSRVPALMRKSTVSVRLTTPSPWQVAQSLLMRPVPLQRGQGMLNFMRPPICVTWPVPWHSGHCVGPPVEACPWQVGHTSWRLIWMRVWPPRIAVQKSTVAWYSRSVPGCGPRGRWGCCAPEKMPEKMSLKLPQDCEPAPCCGPPPAP